MSLLVLLVVVPFCGAALVLALPSADRITARHVGMVTSTATLALGGLALQDHMTGDPWTQSLGGPLVVTLDGMAVAPLFVLWFGVIIAIRAGVVRMTEGTKSFVLAALCFEGATTAAIILQRPAARLVAADVASVALLAMVALHGGPRRGTVTYRTATIFIAADIAALAGVTWLSAISGVAPPFADAPALARGMQGLPGAEPWVFLLLAAPGLVRVAAGPLALWVSSFLEEAPVGATVVVVAGSAPLGAVLLAQAATIASPGVHVLAPWLAGFASAGALLAGVLSLAERDLRRVVGQLVTAQGALVAVALLTPSAHAIASGVELAALGGLSAALACVVIDELERRYETCDVRELAGVGAESPFLGAALALGLLGLAGIPGIGAGSVAWGVLSTAPMLDDLVANGVTPLALVGAFAVAFLMLALGVGEACRRVWSPPLRGQARPVRIPVGQMLRTGVPILLVMLGSVLADDLLEVALPAASSALESHGGASTPERR